MNENIKNLKPERVFYYFSELCRIPHGSGNTKKISDYISNFAKENGLTSWQDDDNNIIVVKPATKGRENDTGVIIQGHIDMVNEKTPDSNHNFDKDGLELQTNGDYIYAKDTTLGGDDGIAVAYALAILEDTKISHPKLEAVFTVDEEIGLLGAKSIDLSGITGKYLLNIDSEDEKTLLIGCAGGLTGKCKIPVEFINVRDFFDEDICKLQINITGLAGGHSGTEIINEHANADILMGRLIHEVSDEFPDLMLADIEGGTKDNAIPRMAKAVIFVDKTKKQEVVKCISKLENKYINEYSYSENGIKIMCQELRLNEDDKCLSYRSFVKVEFFLMQTPCGIINMNKNIEGLVETSLNLGVLRIIDNVMTATYSIRSSVKSRKEALSDKLKFLTEFLGGDYEEEGDYPAWECRKKSLLRDLMAEVYEEHFGRKAVLETIHAGVECGYFVMKKPDIDAVSFGPDILNIHTTEEKMSISSVERVYEYILKILEEIK